MITKKILTILLNLVCLNICLLGTLAGFHNNNDSMFLMGVVTTNLIVYLIGSSWYSIGAIDNLKKMNTFLDKVEKDKEHGTGY